MALTESAGKCLPQVRLLAKDVKGIKRTQQKEIRRNDPIVNAFKQKRTSIGQKTYSDKHRCMANYGYRYTVAVFRIGKDIYQQIVKNVSQHNGYTRSQQSPVIITKDNQ